MGARGRWEAAEKSVVASRESYRFAEEKYESGRANAYELFLAKNNLTQVLGEEAQAKYEYAFRLKILELLKNWFVDVCEVGKKMQAERDQYDDWNKNNMIMKL